MELSHSSVVKLNLQNDEADAVTTKEMERDEVELIGKRSEVMKEKKYLKFYEAGVILCTMCYFTACPILCNVGNICTDRKEGGDGMCQSWFYVYSSFWVFGLLLCFL